MERSLPLSVRWVEMMTCICSRTQKWNSSGCMPYKQEVENVTSHLEIVSERSKELTYSSQRAGLIYVTTMCKMCTHILTHPAALSRNN